MASSFSLFSSSPMITPNQVSIKGSIGSRSKVVMCANNHNSVDLRIRSSHKKKVYEDGLIGIVCYRDEKGEVTCEGYDEGPRIHHQLPRFCFNTRDVEIIEMLERSWLQVAAHHNEF